MIDYSSMRREFILILLGIISISTFSSLLSSYYQPDSENILLDTVVGEVGAGNFSYWHLGHTGSLIIVLNSIKGDADLFVAETIRPTYETDKNNFSSATCGTDVVSVPADFPRPIGIGVFGHWSSAVSEYNIQIYLDKNPPYEELRTALPVEKPTYYDDTAADITQQNKPPPRKSEEKFWFFKFLNILDMVFEMFVL